MVKEDLCKDSFFSFPTSSLISYMTMSSSQNGPFNVSAPIVNNVETLEKQLNNAQFMNDKDTLYRIVKLPPQIIKDDVLMDQFFNGSSFY